MTIRAEERPIIAQALRALSEDDSPRFCDVLWLGLGDRWLDILRDLAAARFVRILDRDRSDGIRITERGCALAEDLSRDLRQTA